METLGNWGADYFGVLMRWLVSGDMVGPFVVGISHEIGGIRMLSSVPGPLVIGSPKATVPQ